MPFYYDFEQWRRDHPPVTGDRRALNTARAARGLLALRATLDDSGHLNHVPAKTTHESLLIATWNIQAFGASRRYEESLFYIAEVLSRFDLIAVQEVKQSLEDLETVRTLLGPWWRYVVSDVTFGDEGNEERLAFLFDARKVKFSGVAGELVLPPVQDSDGNDVPVRQFARTPMLAGFRSGWFDFMLATVHLIWGEEAADHPVRVHEVAQLARHFAARSTARGSWSRNLILLGDFNIFAPRGRAVQALESAGFRIPLGRESLRATNVGLEGRFYDQIAYRFAGRPGVAPLRTGVVDPFDAVFTDAQFELYRDELRTAGGAVPANPHSYYRNHFRRREVSDHLVLWVELPTEFADGYLQAVARD
jgi:endonuclease/exonuclease/phosphatase family metal-dependent hydrolase